MSQPESHIRAMQRFKSFWASVSKITVGRDVPVETQIAIVRGTEKSYGEEDAHGREHE